MTGATRGEGTAYPSGAHEFTTGFQWGSCYSIISFIRIFCRSLFVLLTLVLYILRFADSDYPVGVKLLFKESLRLDSTSVICFI